MILMKRTALAPTLVMALTFSCLFYAIQVQPVKSEFLGSVCINSDGSVTGTDKIQRKGNVYTLTGNISGGIQVRLSYIAIDGASYTVQGNGSLGSRGIDLSNNRGSDPSRYEISNVTVKNMRIVNFGEGIYNVNTGNTTIIGNYIADCWFGITIGIADSDNVLIKNNTIANNAGFAIAIQYSDGNQIITENNIMNNSISVWMSPEPSVDRNYWSDYLTKYPNAKEVGNSGIWDTPYNYDATLGRFTDKHPLVEPVTVIPEFPSWIILPLFIITTLLTTLVYFKKRQKGSTEKGVESES
jgi:parallel beta-helix repeat protein